MTSALDYMGTVTAPPKPGLRESAKQKAAEILADVPRANTITHVWGYDPNASNTEHHSGFAVDFMVHSDKPLGDAIYNYLWANRVRLAVHHIIWQQQITSTVVEPGVRRHMADRGGPTANHMDHVHVLFDDKAYVPPGKSAPAKSKPASNPGTQPMLRNGSRGNAVRSLQNGLNRVFPAYSRLTPDGIFGPRTESVVREFQKRAGLGVDGIVGPHTRAKLASFGVTF